MTAGTPPCPAETRPLAINAGGLFFIIRHDRTSKVCLILPTAFVWCGDEPRTTTANPPQVRPPFCR